MRYVGLVDQAAWDDHINQMSEWARNGRRYAVVIDARQLSWIPATYRTAIRDWVNRDRSFLKANCAGGALIFSNNVQRGLWTAILWMTPIPIPVRVFTDPKAGEAWLREQMASAPQAQV